MVKPILKLLLSVVFSLTAFLMTFAQRDYRFYAFTEKDGLSNNIITNIVEDENHCLWFGSYSGLMKYDGYSFELIQGGSDTTDFRANVISSLVCDREGNVWIASESGVCEYDIQEETFHTYPCLKKGQREYFYQADKVFAMKDGTIRFFSGGFYELDKKNGVFKPIWEDIVSKYDIRNCFACNSDCFLTASNVNKSVLYLNSQGQVIFSITESDCGNGDFPYGRAYAVLDCGDKIYIGGDKGLYVIDVKENVMRKISGARNMKMPKHIASLYMAGDGRIWIGTNGEELHIWDVKNDYLECIKSNPNHNSSNSINSSTTLAMLEDSRGLMWFGTWNGLAFMDINPDKVFKNLVFPECSEIVSPSVISSFAENEDGILAIGTDGGGISFWDKKSDKRSKLWVETQKNHMPNSSVLALDFDSYGNLYTGGYNHPLHRISADGIHDEVFEYSPGKEGALQCNFIKSIHVQNDSMVWVLTNGSGLELFNPKTKKFRQIKSDKNGVKPISLYGVCMIQALDKTIIVGTYGGIFTYDYQKNEIKNYSGRYGMADSLCHNWVNCIYEDFSGRIWVGTCAGLNLFDKENGRFLSFDDSNGFKSLVCSGILEDSSGYLWIATGSGIAKFDVLEGMVVRIYDKNDGILTNSFSLCACLKDSKGTMFFGSNEGLVYFNPREIRINRNVPIPTITELLINYKTVKPTDEDSPLKCSISQTNKITLEYYQSTFSLKFVSLGYLNAKAYKYFYRFALRDTIWNELGSRREIDFAKMDPGTYQIRLRAENPDGVASGVRVLTVKILPPWYKTVWAKVGLLLFLSAFIYLFNYYRVIKIEKQKSLLENQVNIRTQELRNVNQVLEAKNKELNQQAEEILSQRNQLSERNAELQGTYDLIKVKNYAIEGSITYAQTIQQALLTKDWEFDKYFETSAVYHPKDIVSGDFFWLKVVETEESRMVFASVIDCTGHGVPGAFMSIIANTVLNEIVERAEIYSPKDIISELSFKISHLLAQDCSDNKDGMDMVLCRFDRNDKNEFYHLTFSAAKNPLYMRRKSDTEYQYLKIDSKSVAGGIREGEQIVRQEFSQEDYDISSGDIFYLTTDGIIDMGNIRRRRYTRVRLMKLLDRIYDLDMDCQAAEIEKEISVYSEGVEQRDDISLLGLKIR